MGEKTQHSTGKADNSFSNRREILDRAVASCPDVEILIEGRPVRCLIDTGRQITPIAETLFKTLSDCELLDVRC